jgi:hypothetical protein
MPELTGPKGLLQHRDLFIPTTQRNILEEQNIFSSTSLMSNPNIRRCILRVNENVVSRTMLKEI